MIKTPETHPDHYVVGKYFGGHSTKTDKTEVFYCDSYDTAIGYWLTSVTIPGAPERKNVSERAISATYWPAENNEDYFWVTQWGVRVPKLPKDRPMDISDMSLDEIYELEAKHGCAVRRSERTRRPARRECNRSATAGFAPLTG